MSSQRLSIPNFTEQLTVLSQLRSSKEDTAGAPGKAAWGDTKHASLLDGVALLLVTRGEGDVAAVKFLRKRNNGGLVLYWAKNDPVPDQEMEYFLKLAAIVRRLASKRFNREKSLHKSYRLLKIVISPCASKIRQRIKKASRELAEALQEGAIFDSIGKDELDRFRIVVGISNYWSEDEDLSEFVNRLFVLESNMDIDDDGVIHMGLKIHIAYWLSRYEGAQAIKAGTSPFEVLNRKPILRRRLHKIGDYLATCRVLVRLTQGENRLAMSRLQFKQIPSICSTELVRHDQLTVLNEIAQVSHQPQLTLDEVRAVYPLFKDSAGDHSQRRQQNSKNVTNRVHCELLLITHIFKISNLRFCEIGLSEKTCWSCEKWIECLKSEERTATDRYFIFTGFSKKLDTGWMLPGYKFVDAEMKQLVTLELESIITNINQRRHPDSQFNSYPKS